MEANKHHISLDTAKMLTDCWIKSNYVFSNIGGTWIVIHNYEVMPDVELFPAFTWQEILWENAKELFGEKFVYFDDDKNYTVAAFKKYSYEILLLLQKKKYDEADAYFRNACVLIK